MKLSTKSTVNTKTVAQMMLNAFAARCETVTCPATQNAVDALSAEFNEGRDGAIAFLRAEAVRPTDLCDRLLVAWANIDLKRATGKTREEWLDL